MSLYKWTRTGYGRTWDIEVEGSGSPDDLLVDKWPRLSFASRPRKKKAGVYPRRLSLPFIDRAGERGYLSERLFNEELTFNLTLDSNLYFKGTSYAENRPKPIEEDEYRTQIIVSDGLDKLGSIRWEFGTYTYTEFLREVFSQINDLDIHLFTDWDEDNSVGDLPDVNRITIGSPDDTYLDVLKKFCTAYGYQVYQDEGVWVVRSLAYYSVDSITRWVITPTTVSSSLVSTFANLSTQYKSSEIDMVRGVGQARSTFEWPLLEGAITNPEFSDDEVGWGVVGEPPSAGTLNNSSQSYNQKVGSLIRRGDRLNINFRVKLNYEALDTSTTVRYAQVIFRNFNGDVYYLQNDGSVTETPTTLNKFVETPPVSGQDLFIDESFSVNTIIGGFPFTFSGACEIKLVFDSDDGNYNSWTYENADASTEIRTARFTRQVSDSSLGSLPISKIELPISQNSTQYSGNEIEFYNGSAWKPSLVFGGRTFGIKRSFDEIRVRNSNIDILRSEGDFGDFLGMSKLYLYDGVRYIAMASDITIGEDDVTLYLFRHEVSTGFTENEFFDNGGEASVSSVGGAPSSGTSSGGGGLDQSTADARYFRQSSNLSEGAVDSMLGNLSLVTQLKGLTGAEVTQLGNIDTTTISTTQWGYLGALDQNLRTTDTPTFNQNVLSNQATLTTQSVRADRELNITGGAGISVTGGAQNLTGDPSWNLAISTQEPVYIDTGSVAVRTHDDTNAGVLTTGTQNIYGRKQFQSESQFTQDIFLDKGQRWDDVNSFIQTTTYLGGFAGSGARLQNVDGDWNLTVDNITARKRFTVYELMLQQLRAGRGNEIFRSGMEAFDVVEKIPYSPVQDISTAVEDIDDKVVVSHEIYQEDDIFVPFVEGDLLRQQTFEGRNIKLIEATVIDVENGSTVVTDNTTPRYASIIVEEGSDDPETGDQFVALGNETDPDRQGFVGVFSEDEGAPFIRIANGIDEHSKFGSIDTLVGQFGRLDNVIDPDFPSLDGSQNNLYGVYVDGGFFNNVEVRGTVTILDSVNSNAATKNYVDNAVGQGEGNVVIRSDTAPSQRPDGSGLATGDTWIETDEGDKPYTYDGTSPYNISGWIRAYTVIDGGDLETGTVTADKISVGNIKDIDTDAAVVSDIITDYGELSGLPTLGDVSELNSITSTFISNGAVITSKIAAGAVVADKIDVNDLEALEADIAGWEIGDRYMRKLLDGFSSSHVHLSSSVWSVHRTIGAGVFFASEVGAGNIKVAHVGQLHTTDTITPSSDYGFEIIEQVDPSTVKHLVRMGGGDFFITNEIGSLELNKTGISVRGGSSFGDVARAYTVRDFTTNDTIGYFTGVGRQVRVGTEDADLALRVPTNRNLLFIGVTTTVPSTSNTVYKDSNGFLKIT